MEDDILRKDVPPYYGKGLPKCSTGNPSKYTIRNNYTQCISIFSPRHDSYRFSSSRTQIAATKSTNIRMKMRVMSKIVYRLPAAARIHQCRIVYQPEAQHRCTHRPHWCVGEACDRHGMLSGRFRINRPETHAHKTKNASCQASSSREARTAAGHHRNPR